MAVWDLRAACVALVWDVLTIVEVLVSNGYRFQISRKTNVCFKQASDIGFAVERIWRLQWARLERHYSMWF